MSKALDYLVKARPDAMAHYFAFLKDAGKHLDPKTRSLISVITKVDAQTERGFKQYLKRALRDGCSPAEVLDALMMAFPSLGLSKIVWAVDIILAENLPGFDPSELQGVESQWRSLMPVDGLQPDSVQRLEKDGRGVFVLRQAHAFKVYDSRCPHQGTDIQLAAVEGMTLTCPQHGQSFDLRSGVCSVRGGAPLKVLESKVEAGVLFARW